MRMGMMRVLLVLMCAMPALAAGPEVFIQAHRGGLDEVPENTLVAYEHAWSIPGAIPEMDLQTTQDGAIVLMHDDTPARTTDAPKDEADKTIAEVTLAQTQAWDAGVKFGAQYTGTKVPTLDQVFAAMAGKPERQVYLDLKAVDLGVLKQKIVDAHLEKQVIFVHGDIAHCAELKALFPGARVMTWLSGMPKQIRARYEALTDAQLTGVTQLQFHLPLQQVGPPIQYALDDAFLKQAAERLAKLGVDLQVRPMKFDHVSLTHLVNLGIHWYVADAPAAFYKALSTP